MAFLVEHESAPAQPLLRVRRERSPETINDARGKGASVPVISEPSGTGTGLRSKSTSYITGDTVVTTSKSAEEAGSAAANKMEQDRFV